MVSAAVAAAGVTAIPVFLVMVTTLNILIESEVFGKQRMDRRIRLTADAAVELDADLGQSCLRSAADAAADQRLDPVLHQKTS